MFKKIITALKVLAALILSALQKEASADKGSTPTPLSKKGKSGTYHEINKPEDIQL